MIIILTMMKVAAAVSLSSTVTLPLWLVVALLVVAAFAVLERVLLPGMRWAMRRRANRAIEKLNARLQLQIQPFKMTRRKELVDRLVFDSAVLKAVDEHVKKTGEPREVAVDRVRSYAAEIVPSFSSFAYFRIGTRLARLISNALYRVRLGYVNNKALSQIDPNATVVFIMNHRSNMDYILVTYLAATASALSYAVGEWARIWGLKNLIRSMGAYFIRRNSRNALYRRVLARYVAMATGAGVTQAVFLEGGLSRDGKLQEPKLGLLSYMLAGADEADGRDIVFVPVGVNYDRVLEDRTLIAASKNRDGAAPRFSFGIGTVAQFVGHQLWLRLRGRWHRFGYACVGFGEPVSFNTWQAERGGAIADLDESGKDATIAALGDVLMNAIGRVVPVLPVSLAANVIWSVHHEGDNIALTPFELKGRIFTLIQHIKKTGAYVHIPHDDLDYAIDVGLRMLEIRRIVVRYDGALRANPDELELLRYYANTIVHLTSAQV